MRARFLHLLLLASLSTSTLYAQPSPSTPVVTRSRTLVTQGAAPKAIADLSKAIALAPTNPELYIARSFAYGANGDYLKADKDRARYLNFAPERIEANVKRSIQDFKGLANRTPKSAHVYLNLGDLYYYLGDNENAFKNFERATALNPRLAYAYHGLGSTRFQKAEYSQALVDLSKAIALLPSFPLPYIVRGMVYTALHKTPQAQADYNKAIAMAPKEASGYAARGEASLQNQQNDLALKDFGRAIAIEPLSVNLYLRRAQAYLNLDRPDDVIANLDTALALWPQNPNTLFLRGTAYNQKKEYESAIKDFTRAIELNPKDSTPFYNRGAAYYQLAVKNPALNSKALADYTKAITLNPKDGYAYAYRGAYYSGGKDSQLGITDLSKAIELIPQDPNPYRWRAGIYAKNGEQEKALADYRKILSLDATDQEAKNRIVVIETTQAINASPNEVSNYSKRAESYAQLNEYDLALADLEAALKLEPQNAALFNLRGMVNLRRRSNELARADFNQAITLDPKFVKAYENRISLTEKPEDSLADVTRLLELDPQNITGYSRRAVINANQNNRAAAIEDYDQILKLNPKYEPALRERANLYDFEKNPDKAIADYTALLRLNPNNWDVYMDRGIAYFNKGDFTKALADLKRARDSGSFSPETAAIYGYVSASKDIAANPKSSSAYLARAQVMIDDKSNPLGVYDKVTVSNAEADLAKAITLAPRDTEAYLWRAKLRGNTSSVNYNLEKAVADASMAIKLDPKRADAIELRGNFYFSQEKYDKAAVDYLAALKLDPGYAPGAYGRSAYFNEEERKRSIEFFNPIIKRTPHSAAAYLNRGVMYAEASLWSKAIADYSQAIKLDRKLSIAYLLRGIGYSRASYVELVRITTPEQAKAQKAKEAQSAVFLAKASADYSQAIKTDPKFASAYFQRGMESKNDQQKIADLSMAIQLNPRYSGHAHYERARLYLEQKKWDKAIADYQAYMKLPSNSSTRFLTYMPTDAKIGLAKAYFGKGDMNRSIALYNEIVAAPPYGAVEAFLLSRGDVYLHKGETAKAIADYDTALSLFPTYSDAYKSRAVAYRKLGQADRAIADEILAKKLNKKS